MNIFLIILFMLGYVLSIYMETTTFCYANLTNSARIAWRCIMAVPLLGLCAYGCREMSPMNIIILAIIVFVLIADILLINNLLYGIVAFALIHLAIGIFFFAVYPVNNMTAVITYIVLGIVGVIMWLFISEQEPVLKIVVLVYALIMMFSLSRIFMFQLEFGNRLPLLIGYILFVATDFQVAVMNWNGRFSGDQILNNVLYYGALGLIAIQGSIE